MGATNVKRAYETWAGKVPPLSMVVLTYMALVSKDSDAHPWFGQGHAALAERALGRRTAATDREKRANDRAVERAVTPLVVAGAIATDRKPAPRANAPRTGRYRLNLGDVPRNPSDDRPTDSVSDVPRNPSQRPTETVQTPHGNRVTEEEEETGGEQRINQSARTRGTERSPSAGFEGSTREDRFRRYGFGRRTRDAARTVEDVRGRRWLATTFLLDEGQADEVIWIVRADRPNIRSLVPYLEAMHRDEHGEPKPDLLDIIEAVQTAGRRPTAEDDGEEPEFAPPRGFTSPSGCSHDSPNADRTGCNICHADTPVPLAPVPLSKPLTAVPDPCNHGAPGGYLPAAEPDPEREAWPSCVRCQSHVIAAQCHKKTDPCPHCNAIREAAGLPLLTPDVTQEPA